MVAELDELVKDLKSDLDRMSVDVTDKVDSSNWIEECDDLRNLFIKTLQEADPELSKRQRSKAFLEITKRKLADNSQSLSKGDRQKFTELLRKWNIVETTIKRQAELMRELAKKDADGGPAVKKL